MPLIEAEDCLLEGEGGGQVVPMGAMQYFEVVFLAEMPILALTFTSLVYTILC